MATPPILLIIFNRPQHTGKIFEAIKAARPAKLYIACDGPRDGNQKDVELRNATLDVVKNIDWPCTVQQLYREKNLGCKNAVSQAITWFFDNEEYGIVLEDDCLPDRSFFSYCANLLEKYKDDERVMHIAGTNLQNGAIRGDGAYYFSKVCHIWGWATWRRAWLKYDVTMKTYPAFKAGGYFRSLFSKKKYLTYWQSAFDKTSKGLVDTWDYQWVYTVWSNNGLCITPQVNLISNIGFDETATHTKYKKSVYANRQMFEINLDKHPSFVINDAVADTYSMEMFTQKMSLKTQAKRLGGIVLRKINIIK